MDRAAVPDAAGPPRRGASDGGRTGFDLFGPTCDSIDSMPGPHWLPADTDEGDWVEVGMMGAYSNALKTGFNGFASEQLAILRDGGWYLGGRRRQAEEANRTPTGGLTRSGAADRRRAGGLRPGMRAL